MKKGVTKKVIDEFHLHFEEDHLPPGQEPIETESVREFMTLVYLLRETKRLTGYSTMGAVTGRSGIGKSIAIQAYINSLEVQPHTGLPPCIAMRVKPKSTPKAMVEDLLHQLGERAMRLNPTIYKLSDEAAHVILRNDIQLILVDEAELLNEDCIEFLRYIFGKTGCPIVIVGLHTKPHHDLIDICDSYLLD